MSEVFETEPSYNDLKPDFLGLAAALGYKEDDETREIHRYCVETEYRDEAHYGEGILGFIKQVEKTLYSSETQNRYDRLDIRQGIWLSIAAVHYETGHYQNCMRQLFEIHDDILISNDTSRLGELSWMIHHVGARLTGRVALMQHMNTIEQEKTPDFTRGHFSVST